MENFLLEEFLPYKLVRTAEHIANSFAELYETEFGITRPEWQIIANLGVQKNIIARELSELIRLDKVKISRTLAVLEEKKLIIKSPVEGDLRATQLSLSASGHELYQRLVPKALEWENHMLDGLTGTQYRDLCRILDILYKRTPNQK
ncbi:MarR family winged helix-turn-helix transcriptional regulator [Marinomonas sp. 15G1-11]|uniref:MarR family winged helix-turn-helix transcriptional regulator n=1 Tax=Marinomonas phaeophyticola TaxID=3004091 RepID=A0ABT4JWU7_9GAMM|nr:MarR family winged helix-turn-helix transcriptional regulator [Marinomonas sp. 15G1-11]MCZ2722552.1 MarR family winged helix-turn-helix transcriptional regulator [Marinomonas sp. 15G1-11]